MCLLCIAIGYREIHRLKNANKKYEHNLMADVSSVSPKSIAGPGQYAIELGYTKRLFKKSSFDHEVSQEVTRHRILNSAGPSGAHVPKTYAPLLSP